MKTMNINGANSRLGKSGLQCLILILLWRLLQQFLQSGDPTMGYIDHSIWLLVLAAVICYVTIVGLAWWLLGKCWLTLALPDLAIMLTNFNSLEIWQQLGFFWSSFALLLLTGALCLTAIC